MSEYLSHKIKFTSFFLMIVVVILHSQLFEYSNGINLFIQRLFTESLTRIAVPLFFIISGFLFFYKRDNVDLKFFKIKIGRRIKSVVLPYIYWCIIGLLLTILFSYIPTLGDNIQNISYGSFLITPPRFVYQLWFLRDLIACIFLSPILYLGIKKAPIISMILLLYIAQFCWYIEMSSIFHFSIGIALALYLKKGLEKRNILNWWQTLIIGLVWIIGGIVKTYYHYNNFYLQELYIIIGIVFVWFIYDALYEKSIKKVENSWVLSTSFFIYLFQEPLLTIIKKTGLLILGSTNQIGVFTIYITAPILTTIICIIAAYILNRYCKPIYSILVGGRTFKINR